MEKLSGPLPVRLTNDYLFRALLQADEETLKALVAALLHMQVADVTEIEITNPIVLGETIDDKEYHLDISTVLNGEKNVNLEMQVLKKDNWIERSMLYAFRSFDSLSHGEDYMDAEGVIQISFTDFTLFRDAPEFYSTFKLINEKDINQIYSEKIRISNINLTRIDLATEEDRKYKIDRWAKLFKAESWEEVKMLAEKKPEMEKAVSSIWQLSEEEKIKEQIRRRTANEHYHQRLMDKYKRMEERAEEVEREIEEANRVIEEINRKTEEANRKTEEANRKTEEANRKTEEFVKEAEAQRLRAELAEARIKELEELLESQAGNKA